jgi:hypothetical protein
MMTSPDPSEPCVRMARYLRRISVATRVIAILVSLGALLAMLAALGMRRSDDRIGFSLISLALILFGMLVWGTGTFHGAVAEALPTLTGLDTKLDRIARLLNALRAPAPAPPDAEATTGLTAADIEPAAASSETAEPAPEPERVTRSQEPAPEPQKVPCPLCAGLIHPQATRCVHCMRKVSR